MFHEYLYVFLNFLIIFYHVRGEILSNRNDKRIGISHTYEVCLESFDVHKDKIIKAKDSCNMGAKYLNVIDVESREECSKACCDTDKCDVFIFEEKKPGSCYLFECGPIHNFKCKFTNHANYTSAVRAKLQNDPQLEEEIQISQQEHELKSLRKMPNVASAEYVVTEHPANFVPTQVSQQVPTTPLLTSKQGCSRNQYQCRSSGDCIAIYNVCDGIPQCSDGSDEAAELVCPTEKPTVSSSIVIQGSQQLPLDIIKYQQVINQHKPFRPIYSHSPENKPNPWEIPNIARQVLTQQQNLLYPVQQMEIPQIHRTFGSPPYQWDYQPLYDQNKDSYVAPSSYHEQNNFNPYDQNQPHIFNHKGPGIVGETEMDSNRYPDQKLPYQSHFSPPNRETWQDNQIQSSPQVVQNVQQHKQDNEQHKDIQNTVAPPCETSEQEVNVSEKKKEHEKVEKKPEEKVIQVKTTKYNTEKSIVQKSEVPKQTHAHSSKVMDHKGVIVLEKQVKEHERNVVIAERLQQTSDNEILRPKGAIISLALGLIATAITAALITCRLRVVKRRGRRGHGPYAHDADYLVNGMYL